MAPFNPQYQDVGVPDISNATRPVAGPEADKSTGILLKGIGDAVKDAGELFKDTVKVADYNKKKDIESKTQIGIEPIRAEHTQTLEDMARGVGVTIPSDQKGLLGDERAEATDTPEAVKELPKKVSNTVAARADLSQIDLYYKARLDTLAKQIRTEYPGYRDYIDRVFAREMSRSNTANEYVSALSSAFLKNQAALQDSDKKDLAMVYSGVEKGIVDPKYIDLVKAGDGKAIAEMRQQYYSWTSHHAQNERAKDDLSTQEAKDKDNITSSKRIFADANKGAVSILMDDPEVRDFLKRAAADPDSVDEIEANNIGVKFNAKIETLRKKLQQDAIEERPWRDPTTGAVDQSRQPWSHLRIQGQDGVNASIEAALQGPRDVLASFTGGKKNYDYAELSAKVTSARNHTFGAMMSRDSEWGPISAALAAVKDYPEAAREITKQMVGPDKLKALGTAQQGLAASFKLRLINGSTTPLEAVKKAEDVGAGSPTFNRAMFNTADLLTNPNIKPEMKQKLITSFFSDKNRNADKTDMFANMSPKEMAEHYYKWTRPEYVSAVKSLGADAYRSYRDYMTSAFGEQIFKKDIDDIADVNLSIFPDMRITYNDKTNAFGIDIAGKPVPLEGNYHPPTAEGRGSLKPLDEAYLNNTLRPQLKRLNDGINGFKNVMDSTPEQASAAVTNALRGAGHDYTAQGTVAGHMWKSLSNAIKKNNEENQKLVDESNEGKRKFWKNVTRKPTEEEKKNPTPRAVSE